MATAERTVFVKHYLPDTDLDAERASIAMSCLAGRAGVPVASPWTSVQGEVLVDQDGFAVSVWDFVPGCPITGRFTHAQRRDQLPQVAELLAGLPELSSQVLHGDYSAVNLLFDGDRLTAVLDFRPPEAFLIAWELGRIAFDPRTVVLGRAEHPNLLRRRGWPGKSGDPQ